MQCQRFWLSFLASWCNGSRSPYALPSSYGQDPGLETDSRGILCSREAY